MDQKRIEQLARIGQRDQLGAEWTDSIMGETDPVCRRLFEECITPEQVELFNEKVEQLGGIDQFNVHF